MNAPGVSALSRPRVLIVDDEASVVEYVDRVLRDSGYDTRRASDAATALDVAAMFQPNLLLTDLMMPMMNGDELARRMRLLNPDLKVLYLTAFSDRLFAARMVLWENEAFLEKPASIAALREAVSLAFFGHLRGPDLGQA